MANIKADELSKAVVTAVRDYTEDVSAGIKDAIDDTAKELKNEIRDTSPRRPGSQGGSYRRGWRVRKSDTQTSVRRIVHNSTDYQLVHLLEKGHARRGGGRVRAIPHVAPAAGRLLPKLERDIKNVIKSGGKR